MSVFFKLVGQGFRDVALHPWAQLMTLLAVTFITFLAGLMLLGVGNLDNELRVTRGEIAFQLYWKEDASSRQVKAAWDTLRGMDGVMEVLTYTPEEALKDLSSTFPKGNSGLLLADNSPLPYTAVIKFAHRSGDLSRWKNTTLAELQRLPEVETVRSSSLKDEVSRAWQKFSSSVTVPVLVFLVLILSIAVGNTMKLSLISRQDEIEILKLVGAKNWYIRTPLLVGGALLGSVGGMLGILGLYATWWNLKDTFNFAPLHWELQFLPVDQALLLVLIPMCVGCISSWVAVRN
ncbi:cell division protein FtsX [Halodesulfovibrio marinisediminis]|uniref:Cell division protein FtsX n=1 Tax=Halodesulfovibrio marinisediminis DSM 17456 TaxID=1121457 RepID=A0A1N6FA45_9BACT|nr:permease-like cell division protein FtsX [Halodesulfovibrio marinisediminis]SIN92155.1 cell division transport system permease protein [Halodesulfovibrio marinisediminis DSM 17456]